MSKERTRLEAVALRYDPIQNDAPRVTATGQGLLAQKILDLAAEHDVPIREDRNLIQVLSRLDLDEEIPHHVYRAVAEILAFIYLASCEMQGRDGPAGWNPKDTKDILCP